MGTAGALAAILLIDVFATVELTLLPSVAKTLSSHAHTQFCLSAQHPGHSHSLGQHEPLLWPGTRCKGCEHILLGREQAEGRAKKGDEPVGLSKSPDLSAGAAQPGARVPRETVLFLAFPDLCLYHAPSQDVPCPFTLG